MKTNRFLLFFALACITAAAASPQLLPFQGRLTDATGKPIADGATAVQFQIFGDPTSPIPVWSGEVHRTTINSGLLNVTLGAKNPFPLSRTNEVGAVLSFFDAPIYLEVTVDSSVSSDGKPDGFITKADPPLLPRQAILPVAFAREAADSRKLAGHDWSSVFGVNDPSAPDARMPGGMLLDGSVTRDKLAFPQIGVEVGLAGIAMSESVDLFINSSVDFVEIPSLTVTLQTMGRRPVLVFLAAGAPQTCLISKLTHWTLQVPQAE